MGRGWRIWLCNVAVVPGFNTVLISLLVEERCCVSKVVGNINYMNTFIKYLRNAISATGYLNHSTQVSR